MKVEILSQSAKAARVLKLTDGKKYLATPTYFPAVSGAKLNIHPDRLINLLLKISYPRMLLSSYDISLMREGARRRITVGIRNYAERGSFTFLDSGNFESYLLKDRAWSFDSYNRCISEISSDFYSSFDVFPGSFKSQKDFVARTTEMVLNSRSITTKSECVAIFHGSGPDKVITTIQNFCESYPADRGPIAVAERDCGATLSERAQTIVKLRRMLNRFGKESILHILGCGNPVSIALYSYCGADMFDSLDWARSATDRFELRQTDPSYFELFGCSCRICTGKHRNRYERMFLHNLLWYQDYMLEIQDMIKQNTLRSFVLSRLKAERLDTDFMQRIT